jgi:hypothetical protein
MRSKVVMHLVVRAGDVGDETDLEQDLDELLEGPWLVDSTS